MGDTAITTWLVVGAALALAGWDAYVAFFNRIPNSQDTISGQLKVAGEKVRALPFAFGVLGGHFFWHGAELVPQPWAALSLVLAAAITTVALRRMPYGSLIALATGIVAGRVLWPQ